MTFLLPHKYNYDLLKYRHKKTGHSGATAQIVVFKEDKAVLFSQSFYKSKLLTIDDSISNFITLKGTPAIPTCIILQLSDFPTHGTVPRAAFPKSCIFKTATSAILSLNRTVKHDLLFYLRNFEKQTSH
jgi:hypothetical protein